MNKVVSMFVVLVIFAGSLTKVFGDPVYFTDRAAFEEAAGMLEFEGFEDLSKEPIEVQLVAGQTYAWCSCGLSSNQPFCDGSHSGTGMTPKIVKADKDQTAWFCLCKNTQKPPSCDGAHSMLK